MEYGVSWYFINYRNLILMRSCSYFIHLFEEYSFYNYCRIYINMMCLSTLFDCLSLFYFYRVLLCFIFIILLQRFNTCVWFSNGNKLIVLVSKIAKFNETAQEISQRLFSSYYYNLYLFLPFIFWEWEVTMTLLII